MVAHFEFLPAGPDLLSDRVGSEGMTWIATRCRKVAQEHMAFAEKPEELMNSVLGNRRFRTGLRTFARHHRRAAWQHLEMARRAEAAQRTGCGDFDLADVVSV